MTVDAAASPDAEAVLAMTRFGYGASPGRRQAIRLDPRGAVIAEIRDPASAILACDLPGARPALAMLKADQQARRIARAAAAPGMMASGTAPSGTAPSGMGTAAMAASGMPSPGMTMSVPSMSPPPPASGMVPDMAAKPATGAAPPAADRASSPRDLMLAEAALRLRAAATSPTPLVERLVAFWSNHFCVATDKDEKVLVLAGPFERTAIRPHVLGRFEDMLLAVARHPAMLNYLDNDTSIGPNSEAGSRTGRGLNENLAREIMELHTVGVGAGYTQGDVTAFARVLTGWTFRNDDREPAIVDPFVFNEAAHEPGDQTVMGRLYPDDGLWQGVAVLRDLARHPATARHVAAKLATAFVADPPPAPLVDRLARRFLDTGGDLREVTAALVAAPEAWAAPRRALITPYGFVVAIGRVADPWSSDVQQPFRALQALGEPLWRPPAPKGFSDAPAPWLGPAAMKTRVEVALAAARRIALPMHPADLAADLYGDVLSAETAEALRRSESPAQGLALLFMSPEFQRI